MEGEELWSMDDGCCLCPGPDSDGSNRDPAWGQCAAQDVGPVHGSDA